MLQVSAPEGKSGIESAAFTVMSTERADRPDLSIAAGFLMMNLRIAQEQREIFPRRPLAEHGEPCRF